MIFKHQKLCFDEFAFNKNDFWFITGIVEGTGVVEETGITFCKCLFGYMSPVLPDMVTLLSIYHNYQQISQLILELFRECSHTMLCYLGKVSASTLMRDIRVVRT